MMGLEVMQKNINLLLWFISFLVVGNSKREGHRILKRFAVKSTTKWKWHIWTGLIFDFKFNACDIVFFWGGESAAAKSWIDKR